MIKNQKKKQYQYTDLTMICGIVSMEPEIKTTSSGKSCAEFSVGQKFGSGDNVSWKNYKARAYDEIGNEILALVKKNDSVLLLGHLNAYIFHTKAGEAKAGMVLSVTEWKKAPDAKEAKAIKEQVKNSAVIVDEDGEAEEEPEDMNEETLF